MADPAREAVYLYRRCRDHLLKSSHRTVRDRLASRRYDIPAEAKPELVLWGAGKDRNDYIPCPWGVLERLLPVEEVGPQDVFIDIGCGAGRVVLEAADRYPFTRVLGVELSPDLADAARLLLAANERLFEEAEWEIVTADATDYEIPDDVTVVFFYDPFSGPVLDAALAQVFDSMDRHPRPLRVVYLKPKAKLDWLRTHPRLEVVKEGRCSLLRSGCGDGYTILEVTRTPPPDAPSHRSPPLPSG